MAKKTFTNLRENPEQALLDRYIDEIAMPTAMSADEERELCSRISAGDERALNKLVEAHLPLVVSIAKRFVREGVSQLDLIAEGNIGLIRSAHKFDASRGQRFAQYAVYDIRKSMQDFLPSDEVRMKRSTEYLPSGGAAFDEGYESSDMVAKLMMLNERERVVLRAFYGIEGESMTMAEIGEKYGFRRERVRQIRNTALRKLRNLRNVKI